MVHEPNENFILYLNTPVNAKFKGRSQLTAIATIADKIASLPKLKVEYVGTEISRTETLAGTNAVFKVTSSTPFDGKLDVVYQPVKAGGNYLDESNGPNNANWSSGEDRTVTLEFTQDGSNYIAPLRVATIDDPSDNDGTLGGTIEVTLQEDPAVDDTYTLSDTTSETF